MANDPDALFPRGPTTRRGLLTALSRRNVDLPTTGDDDAYFAEEPPTRIEPVRSGEALVAEIEATREKPGMHIWWLGQSGFLVLIAGETILLDPYLSNALAAVHAGTDTPHDRITDIVVEPELLSFVDIVAISNGLPDHLDPGTLPGVLSGKAAFVCASGTEDLATTRAGRRPDVVLGARDDESFGNYWIEAVPAHHALAPEAIGYIVRNGPYAFYYAGDSRRVQGMAEAVESHGVDAAIVPINGTNGNMDGADAARLACEACAGIAIPCHHGMFHHDTASTSRFVAECVRIRQEYRLPRPGERATIDYGY